MWVCPTTGFVVVLNGAPRSGKSTIARAVQDSFQGTWMNLGVDAFCEYVIPVELRPGIGLRPGGERPDLEEHLPVLFDALYGSVIALSRLGLHVVVDVGHHDDYSTPLGILTRVAEELADRPAYFIGVRCPVDVVMRRRDAGGAGREDRYAREWAGRGRSGSRPSLATGGPRPRDLRPRGRHLGPIGSGVRGGDQGSPGPGTPDGLLAAGETVSTRLTGVRLMADDEAANLRHAPHRCGERDRVPSRRLVAGSPGSSSEVARADPFRGARRTAPRTRRRCPGGKGT